jgi:hypothetical protein
VIFLGLSLQTIRKIIENKNLNLANNRISFEIFNLYSPAPTESELASIKRATAIYELRANAYMEEYKKYSSTVANGYVPKNEVDLYFSLMSFVKALQEKAEELDIRIPKDLCFSFEPYLKKDLIPTKDEIYLIHRQSLAILKLLSLLFRSRDRGFEFISVERESIAKDKNNFEGPYTFSSEKFKTKTSKTKDIESSLFRIIFVGYSSCLRNFMNNVVKKSLPVLFKEIRVSAINLPETKDGIEKKEPIIIAEHNKSKIEVTLEWLFMNHDGELPQQVTKE